MKENKCNVKTSKSIKVISASRITKRGSLLYGQSVYLPKIQMEGKWLEKLGFHIGDKLTVTYEEGWICITKAAEEHSIVGSESMESFASAAE